MNSALLTIDDIASKNTPAIVDYLNEKRIKAILFATGQNVERYYEEALYAVKNGMIVGNHSYSHPAFSSLTMKECMEEIEKFFCSMPMMRQRKCYPNIISHLSSIFWKMDWYLRNLHFCERFLFNGQNGKRLSNDIRIE